VAIGTALFRLHRTVISQERRGLLIGLARAGLLVPAALYGVAVRARNACYRTGLARVHRASVPVISVGNLSAGGVGKTPFAAWLARFLVIRRMRPAILSRGYGRHARLAVDDENALLSALAPQVPVVVDPDRVLAARRAAEEQGAEVLILDDGFQHRRLARDLDIVLIDALWPFGAAHILPRGLLREPLSALRRAGFLVVTRANLVRPEQVETTARKLERLAPGVPTAWCADAVRGLRPLGAGAEHGQGLSLLREGRWGAFCGIGNPEGFALTLKQSGCDAAFLTVYSDHEPYTPKQMRLLLRRAAEAGCTGLVTTEKDAVKVEKLLPAPPSLPAYALQMELHFTKGSDALASAILQAVGKGGLTEP